MLHYAHCTCCIRWFPLTLLIPHILQGMFFFRSRSGDDDLAVYRAHYPKKREDTSASDNVKFYQNKLKGPEGMKIEELLTAKATDYRWLEYCHSFVQWMFPIQEHGMNPDAQVLMKHEIKEFSNNDVMLRRAWRCFCVMVNFYGMDVTVVDGSGAIVAEPTPAHYVSNGRCSLPWRVVTSSSVQFIFERRAEAPLQVKLYRNLNTSGHNYLRITRILKFLGELGMEDVKVSWLTFFAQEVFVTKALRNCDTSLEEYWSGTVYDDDARAAFSKWVKGLHPATPLLPALRTQTAPPDTSSTVPSPGISRQVSAEEEVTPAAPPIDSTTSSERSTRNTDDSALPPTAPREAEEEEDVTLGDIVDRHKRHRVDDRT